MSDRSVKGLDVEWGGQRGSLRARIRGLEEEIEACNTRMCAKEDQFGRTSRTRSRCGSYSQMSRLFVSGTCHQLPLELQDKEAGVEALST